MDLIINKGDNIMMTKKDLNAVSSILEMHLGSGVEKDKIVSSLADYFETTNPNFNRGMFVHACYWTKEAYKKQLDLAGTKEVA
jgi:hypothetical protein